MWYFKIVVHDLLLRDPDTGMQYALSDHWIFWGYYSRRSLNLVSDRFSIILGAHAKITIFRGLPPADVAPGSTHYYKDSVAIEALRQSLIKGKVC